MREGVYSMGMFSLHSPCFPNLYRKHIILCPLHLSLTGQEEKSKASQKEVNDRDGDMVGLACATDIYRQLPL